MPLLTLLNSISFQQIFIPVNFFTFIVDFSPKLPMALMHRHKHAKNGNDMLIRGNSEYVHTTHASYTCVGGTTLG